MCLRGWHIEVDAHNSVHKRLYFFEYKWNCSIFHYVRCFSISLFHLPFSHIFFVTDPRCWMGYIFHYISLKNPLCSYDFTRCYVKTCFREDTKELGVNTFMTSRRVVYRNMSYQYRRHWKRCFCCNSSFIRSSQAPHFIFIFFFSYTVTLISMVLRFISVASNLVSTLWKILSEILKWVCIPCTSL